MVRGLGIERWMTLKGLNEEFDPESLEEYYRNKIKEEDIQKFIEYSQIQITVFKPKRN